MKRPFGTARQLPSGRWQARYRDPFTGERITGPLTFTRRGDATRWLATVEADIARGVWEDKSKAARVTVAEYAERWLVSDPNKRASTLARDRQALEHFTSRLGARPLASLTPTHVQEVVAELAATQAPATVRRNLASFKAMLNAAVDADLLPRSPVRGVKLPRVLLKEHPELGVDEVRRLVAEIPARHRALVMTAAVLGLRWGELAGLVIGDLDVEASTLHVRRQLSELAGHLSIEPTKTRQGVRSLAVPPFLLEVLVQHLREHRRGAGPDEPLFVGSRGGLLRRNFVARVLRPAAVRAGLPVAVTSHGLRHVAAALMVEAGEHPKVMQRRLGHADARLTLDVYASVSDEADRAAARRLGRLFDGPER